MVRHRGLKPTTNRYHHMTQSEKIEIITLVEQSPLGVKATLNELGINRSTFYQCGVARAVQTLFAGWL